jgi:LmbE family N-acetylglucosaminyl deacetylase
MNVLVIAPHPDDEVIGCGGVIAKHVANNDEVHVCIVSEGKPDMYSEKFIENEEEEMSQAHKLLGVWTERLGFPSAKLDTVPQHEINDRLTEMVQNLKPDVVYIPYIGDVHRDHRIVSEAAMVAVRPNKPHKVSKVLAYEVLSETDWFTPDQTFSPNVYESIDDYIGIKIGAFMKYRSQVGMYPGARTPDAIKALAVHRGAIIGERYAEAFMLMREIR